MNLKANLAHLAEQVMKEMGLEPNFSKEALEQAASITSPAPTSSDFADLRSKLWCSIDNDDSRDLDQLTYAEIGPDRKTTLWIAIADVDALVPKDSPIDLHAQMNTTSVYTPGKIFTMLPEKLSFDLTSLNEKEDRLAMVVEVKVNDNGDLEESSIFQAMVHNYAKLAYDSVGKWLEGTGVIPDKIKSTSGLEPVLRIQHEAAQKLRKKRHEAGSLTLQSSAAESKVLDDDQIVIQPQTQNFAQQLIEELMIAANRKMAEHFAQAKVASLRRVIRIPKYWDKIVEVAKGYGVNLPDQPDSKALDAFLVARQKAQPESFPDLSLTIIKLLGRGEYIVENDSDSSVGHFALAVADYTHSTAPNRRFPDIISQRQYKAFLRNEKKPYELTELYRLAAHCTQQENMAQKVERRLNKSAAAELLSTQIGLIVKGIVTGVGEKGTWVRIFNPAVDGKIIQSLGKLNIGDIVRVQLKHVDILKGFIDFAVV